MILQDIFLLVKKIIVGILLFLIPVAIIAGALKLVVYFFAK